jgi:hypothetical protein
MRRFVPGREVGSPTDRAIVRSGPTPELFDAVDGWAVRGAFVVTLVAALFVAAVALRRNAHEGAWFDEYATVWFSDPALGLRQLFVSRWASETNPPTYYAVIWFLRESGITSIRGLRAFSIVPYATVIGYAIWRALWSRTDRCLILAATLIFLGTGDHYRFLPELRSYYWQVLSAFGFSLSSALLLLRAAGAGASDRLNRADALTCSVSLFMLMNLHFTAALLGGCLWLWALWFAWVQGDRRLVLFLLVTGVVSGGIAGASILIRIGLLAGQVRTFWIETSTTQALLMIGQIVLGAVSKNIVLVLLVVAAVVALAVPSWRQEDGRRETEVGLVFAGAVVSFLSILLLLNIWRPIVILIYIASAAPVLSMAFCLLAAPLLRARWRLMAAVMANALLVVLINAVHAPGRPRDVQVAHILGQLHQTCPSARLLGVQDSAPAGDSNSERILGVRRFSEIEYTMLAQQYDLPIKPVSADQPWQPPRSQVCPTAIWAAHLLDFKRRDTAGNEDVTVAGLASLLHMDVSTEVLGRSRLIRLQDMDPILILPPETVP